MSTEQLSDRLDNMKNFPGFVFHSGDMCINFDNPLKSLTNSMTIRMTIIKLYPTSTFLSLSLLPHVEQLETLQTLAVHLLVLFRISIY